MTTYSKLETAHKRVQRGVVAALFLAAYTISAVAPFVTTQAAYAQEAPPVETQSVEAPTEQLPPVPPSENTVPVPEPKTIPEEQPKPEPENKPETPAAENKPEVAENVIGNLPTAAPLPENSLALVEEKKEPKVIKLKDWVCKYVGTPGVNERLKNGNDGLVWVDSNATEGSWFNDKHGRSYVVLANASKDAQPDASLCPAPDNEPDEVPLVEPTVRVVCGPNNDIITLPEVEHVTYELKGDGWKNGKARVTATADKGYYFEGTEGDKKIKWDFVDENTDCVATLAEPTVTVVCGPNNDTVVLPEVEHIMYSQTGWVDGKNTVTATAHEGYYFAGTKGQTEKQWVLTDENTSCGEVLGETTTTPNVLAAVAPAGALQDTGNDMLLPMLLSMGILGLAILTMTQNSTNRRRSSRLAAFFQRGKDQLTAAFAQPFSTI